MKTRGDVGYVAELRSPGPRATVGVLTGSFTALLIIGHGRGRRQLPNLRRMSDADCRVVYHAKQRVAGDCLVASTSKIGLETTTTPSGIDVGGVAVLPYPLIWTVGRLRAK